MSAGDQAAAAIATQLALAADGAVLGLTLAYVAVRTLIKFASTSSALKQIRDAPSVSVSDLRSLLTSSDNENENDVVEEEGGRLVVVRGIVEAKAVVASGGGSGWFWNSDVLLSHDSSERAVVVERSQKCIYNEWRSLFGWYPDLRGVLARAWRQQGSTSIRKVPFVLIEDRRLPQSDYVFVELDGSKHPLPLTTVYHKMQPIQATPYTFVHALFGHEIPVGLLDEEKILPIGKDITAVGICSLRNAVPEIKSSTDLPYFLTEMTKDQMIVDLSSKSKILLWSGVIVGSVSIGVLGYAIMRNWNKWKQWREERRRFQQQSQDTDASGSIVEAEVVEEEEDVGDVPDGQLCVVCLMRRRRSAFVPCGHMVCCQRCALAIERDLAPKCPVCRQEIRNSVRIYDS